MYVSVSRLRVAPDRIDELVQAFRSRAHLVDAAEGFIDLQVWRSERDPGDVRMVSRWRTRAAFTAYMRGDAHRISHERITLDLRGAIALERLEHLEGFEVVAE